MRTGNGIGHVTGHVRLPSPGGECSWCEHCLSFRGLSRASERERECCFRHKAEDETVLPATSSYYSSCLFRL